MQRKIKVPQIIIDLHLNDISIDVLRPLLSSEMNVFVDVESKYYCRFHLEEIHSKKNNFIIMNELTCLLK